MNIDVCILNLDNDASIASSNIEYAAHQARCLEDNEIQTVLSYIGNKYGSASQRRRINVDEHANSNRPLSRFEINERAIQEILNEDGGFQMWRAIRDPGIGDKGLYRIRLHKVRILTTLHRVEYER